MDQEFEGLQRRRDQRYEYRQQRSKKDRQLLVRIGIALGVLLLCAVGIFLLSRGNGAPSETTLPQLSENTEISTGQTEGLTQATEENPQETTQEITEETTEVTVPPDTVIHIAAAGDLNVTDRVVAAGGEAHQYTGTFLDVGYLLADADIAVVNLEGNLVGEPYGSAYYSAPQSMASALAAVGVDLVQLANSYSIRNGMSGLASTIDGIRAAGMEPLGAYATEKDYRESGGYSVVEVQGIRVGFVSFTKGMDGMTLPPGNEDCVNVLYTDYDSTYQGINERKIRTVLDNLRREKPDVVVAMLHWGSEFNDTISNSQKKIVELLQDQGVNAIIGTHSHYVQQMVFDEEKGTFLAYSLGNFLGDADRSGSEYSVILDLEITRDGSTGKTRVSGFSYTPIFTVAQEDAPLRVVRIAEAMAAYEAGYIDRVAAETYEKMSYALGRIEARIQGE